jgi:tetratricopeptide (TPR) repeat protein
MQPLTLTPVVKIKPTTMRVFTSIGILCLLSIQLFSQVNIKSEQWQEDLRFLQHQVQNDYSFLFKKVSQETFNAEVEKLHKAIPTMQEHEIHVGFSRIVSLFQYGHTSFPLYNREKNGFHATPFNLYHFKDGLYIQGTHKDYEEALGAKVLKVEGTPVEKAMKAIYPVVPAENKQFFLAYYLNYLGVPEILHAQGLTKELKKSVTLELEKDGRVFSTTFTASNDQKAPTNYGYVKPEEEWLDARDQSSTPLYLKNLDRIYFYEYLPEQKAVYVRHSQIQDESEQAIPEFYAEVFDFIENNEVDRLILDVRLNGGGNNYKNKPIIKGVIQSKKIDQVGHFFVIIGRKTFSACQNLVNELDNYTNAIFVGEPTGENINFYGDNRTVTLPNSQMPVYLSFAWWQDKPQWENRDWTAPHLAVDMSFSEYQSNQDPVLDVALNFDSENIILDPMGYLQELYMAGEKEKLGAEAGRLIKDPMYQFYDFEEEFNNTGYRLLNAGQTQTAIEVFGFNTQLFPDSPNCWDSLAEAHWKNGDLEKAKALYNKAIQMDPEGPTGENARMMLKKIGE